MKSRKFIALGDHVPLTYIIASSWDGPCKIGYTTNLQKRLMSLQTGNWEPLSVYGFRVAVWMDGFKAYRGVHAALHAANRALESAAHKALADCDLHLSGEWFDITVEEARQVLDKCATLERIQALTVEKLAEGYMGHAAISENVAAQQEILRSMIGPATYVAEHQPHPLDKVSVSA